MWNLKIMIRSMYKVGNKLRHRKDIYGPAREGEKGRNKSEVWD